MGLPRTGKKRRELEARVRSACIQVECPEHGMRPRDIVFTWAGERLEVKVEPLPCCQKQSDAICDVFRETIGGRSAN